MLEEAGLGGLPMAALVSRAGYAPERASALVASLTQSQEAVQIGETLVARAAVEELKQAVMATLRDYHRAQPLSEGIPREEVRERLCSRAAPGVFERVLEELAGASHIVSRDRLAIAGHRVALSDKDAELQDRVAKAYLESGLEPGPMADVAASLGVPRETAERMVAMLVRQKVLVKVDTLVFHSETLDRLKREIVESKSSAPPGGMRFDVAMFKARYGITRKYAIPLLEYLDRERITRRVGEVRVVI